MKYKYSIIRSSEPTSDYTQDTSKIDSFENGEVDFSTINFSVFSNIPDELRHIGNEELEKLNQCGEVTFSRLEKVVVTVKTGQK